MAKRKLTLGPVDAGDASGDVPEVKNTRPAQRRPLLGQPAHSVVPIEEELRERIQQIEGIREDVLRGKIPIEVDPGQLVDLVGTDREENWQDSEDFRHLLESIKAKGQMQPIEIRPLDPDWQPGIVDPLSARPGDDFALRSGRRRVEACRQLGVRVRAFLSADNRADMADLSKVDLDAPVQVTVGEDVRTISTRDYLADLEGRFAENNTFTRKDLRPIDFMRSLARTAEFWQRAGKEQKWIARHLHVNEPTLSLALGVMEFEDVIVEAFGGDLSVRRLRDVVPMLRKGVSVDEIRAAVLEKHGSAAAPKSPNPNKGGGAGQGLHKRSRNLAQGGSISIRPTTRGVTITAKKVEIPESKMGEFEERLAKLIERYAAR